ncbi:hypothetical protein [Maritimibacter dapengensis]|uniref:PIN domain-containing protein n=1 Tax=Maritimibacter dapengensis TaxID=2836868 RepID=A0ABS6T5X2_9RHOB|nr:hypothetical protein [Maritimibacter dapengensis]MBV7380355.1 hypothetical protein [Maritimibacter dapengensis]
MAELVGILDTGVFCCWLEVPGKETANSGDNRWDNAKANIAIQSVIDDGGTIILPNSVVIETARFISQCTHSNKLKAEQLLDRTIGAHGAMSPWKKFNESDRLWTKNWYQETRDEWPMLAEQKISLTDYSLLWIAKFYADLGCFPRVLTTERKLHELVQALEPSQQPRRRRG